MTTGRREVSVTRRPISAGSITWERLARSGQLDGKKAGFDELHLAERETVGGRKDPEHQLGTELIESMAAQIIRRCREKDAATDFGQPHQVGDGDRKIEDVLQRTAIDDRVETLPQVGRNRLVHVVDQARSLVSGGVEHFERFGVEEVVEEAVRETGEW